MVKLQLLEYIFWSNMVKPPFIYSVPKTSVLTLVVIHYKYSYCVSLPALRKCCWQKIDPKHLQNCVKTPFSSHKLLSDWSTYSFYQTLGDMPGKQESYISKKYWFQYAVLVEAQNTPRASEVYLWPDRWFLNVNNFRMNW